jgi:Centromere protein Scm3
MEPPRKRQRLSPNESPEPTDDFDLQTARAQNDRKLKSLFEGIFEKYGRDFSDIGDEIDLRTGEIVVNKGHVQRMEHEDDTGELSELAPPKKAISQFLSGYPQNTDTSDESPILQDAREGLFESDNEDFKTYDPLPDNNVTAIPKDVARDEDSKLPSLSPTRQEPPTPSRPIDPLWQPPEIDANFWTPSKMETPKKTNVTPRKEHVSSPTTTSIWAIPSSRRPRGSNSKNQTPSNKKRTPTQSKRKRKVRVKLDWSFAQRGSEDSDSDDPLQDDAPPSSTRSIKIHGHPSVPQTPKAVDLVSNSPIDVIPIDDDELAEPEETRYDEPEETHYDVMKATTPEPETPEVYSSSPATGEDTPTQKNYFINLESPMFIQPEEIILTPDEVKLIIQLKFEDTDTSWEEIVEHLPGRTLNDLLGWVDHRPHLLHGIVTNNSWSLGDLKKLGELADQSGIWWRDFQILFPHRRRKEIEDQVIQLWAEKHPEQTEQPQDDEQNTVEVVSTKRKRSRTPYSDDSDPALKTGDVMTNDDLEDLLQEESDKESDKDWSEISAIDVKARKVEVFDSPRGSPRKGSASPRKYY